MNEVDISNFSGVKIIEYPKVIDENGELSYLNFLEKISFSPKRIFYIENIQIGSERGNHAHLECFQALIILRGSVTLQMDDYISRTKTNLMPENKVYVIKPLIWIKLENFSTDALIMVFASDEFTEKDYVRERLEFESIINAKK